MFCIDLACCTPHKRRQLSFYPVAQRLRRKGRQTPPAFEVRYGMYTREHAHDTKFTGTNVAAASCHRKLGNAKKSHPYIKQAWTRHRPKDHLLQPRQPIRLNHATAHVQDQVRQGYLDRAHGFAGVTAYTQTLRSRICLESVVERRYYQSNCATVDVAEDVTSDLLVGRADVGTGRAAYAAQRLFKMRISPHLTAAIIDKHNVHLFVRRRGTRDKSRIARNLLGCGTACK